MREFATFYGPTESNEWKRNIKQNRPSVVIFLDIVRRLPILEKWNGMDVGHIDGQSIRIRTKNGFE